jgi:hypothetical protein
MLHELKRMRLLCSLRQIDVWAATGIPVGKLSLAEQGRVQLSKPEETLLISFLRAKWNAIQQLEATPELRNDTLIHFVERVSV